MKTKSQGQPGLLVAYVRFHTATCWTRRALPPGAPPVDAEVVHNLSFTQERGTKAADGKSNSSPARRARFGDGRWWGDWTPGSRWESCGGFGRTCPVAGTRAAAGVWSGGRQLGSALL